MPWKPPILSLVSALSLALCLALLLAACGARTDVALEERRDSQPDATVPDSTVPDAALPDASTGPCRWGPVRAEGGAIAPPVRFPLRPGDTPRDVQLVTFDEGFFFVVKLEGGAAEYGWFGDALLEEPSAWVDRLRDGPDATVARLGASSSSSYFAIGGRIINPRTMRLGLILPGQCQGLVSGDDGRIDAWMSGDLTPAFTLYGTRSEAVTAVHEIRTDFPEAVLGVAWDGARRRSLFLTSEIRDALPNERLRIFEGDDLLPREVLLENPDGVFVWHQDLALLSSGRAATLNLSEGVALHLHDPDTGERLAERPVSADLRVILGRPSEGDLAPFGEEVLAYLEGALLLFSEDRPAELLFDERDIDRPGARLRGFDVAARGTHAVTATGLLEEDGNGALELRHYECL